jgi:hypothetical protein
MWSVKILKILRSIKLADIERRFSCEFHALPEQNPEIKINKELSHTILGGNSRKFALFHF